MEMAGRKKSKIGKKILWLVLILVAVIQIFPLAGLVD